MLFSKMLWGFSWFLEVSWFKRSEDIPLGCVIFTDGSLLDDSLSKGCQSLGWDFVVIDSDGELVAAAHGVPPEWIDIIQGAELWAEGRASLCCISWQAFHRLYVCENWSCAAHGVGSLLQTQARPRLHDCG